MELKNLVKVLVSELNRVSKSDAVVGSVRDVGNAKMMPLSRISIGFGTASAGVGGKTNHAGKQSDAGVEGGGAGGALVIEPRAFVVVGEDGVPHLLALQRGKSAVLRRGVEILPQGELSPQLSRGEPRRLEALDKGKK
jgi:uncharacterized spore protein YtfJ